MWYYLRIKLMHMKYTLFALSALLIVTFTFVTPANAYFTTNQESFTVDGKTNVYTINFEFGHAKHDIYIPVHANNSYDAKTDALSYALHDADGKTLARNTVAIVLSNAPTKDGMYVVKKGTKRSFTLLVIETPTPGVTGAQRDTKLQVTHLPFNFDGKQQLQLNPSELTYYVTNGVDILK